MQSHFLHLSAFFLQTVAEKTLDEAKCWMLGLFTVQQKVEFLVYGRVG